MSQPRSTTDNAARSRIELRVDGALAGWLEYRPAGESIILAHSHRHPELEEFLAPSARRRST